MSLFDYEQSRKVSALDPTFSALVMALLRKADTDNAARIAALWPHLYAELRERYDSPGGLLPDERCNCTAWSRDLGRGFQCALIAGHGDEGRSGSRYSEMHVSREGATWPIGGWDLPIEDLIEQGLAPAPEG